MHITQKEIADRLGVSRQLVTHALNGVGTISEQRRREVIEAAEKMGYRRNELARAVATGHSRILGILTGAEITDSMARTIAGAMEEAANHGYATKLMILPFDANEAETQQILQRCSAWRLDGALVIGLSDEHVEKLQVEMAQGNRPVAFASNLPPEESIGAYSDDASAWRLAVQHLLDLGHRRIAHLGAMPTSKIACNRRDICLATLREFGLEVDDNSSTMSAWNEPKPIEAGVHRLLDAPQPPTALLCAGDSIAMVAIRVARKRGISVPEQLSIIGFGNYSTSALTDPPLTSIAQPHEEVARHAIRELLVHIELEPEKVAPPKRPQRIMGCELIVRESTAPAP